MTQRVAGETLGRRIVSDPRFEAVRPQLARQCGEILAQIHATPPPVQPVASSSSSPDPNALAAAMQPSTGGQVVYFHLE